MLQTVISSKTAKLGVVMVLGGVASYFIPQVDAWLSAQEVLSKGDAVLYGLTLMFGRDAVEKVINTLKGNA